MDPEIFFLAASLFIAPLVISLVAISQVSSLKKELRALKRTQRTPLPIKKPLPQPLGSVEQVVPKQQPMAKPVQSIPKRLAASAPVQPKLGLEFMMGGKAAAFAGIGILVIGIVLLVGYAIQHTWFGPGARSLMGLAAGVVLVGLGYYFERKSPRYHLFAQVLTGGGSALFYFTVYAAYGFYRLISGITASAGLFVSAFAVFGLAMVYHSQAVAVLGVFGAFVTPFLIGGESDMALFARKILSRYSWEILSFLAGGLFCITLAVRAQFNGEWVSLGWALEGIVVAWFATRVKSRALQTGAFVLGMMSLMKGLLFDVTLYVQTPALFMNARFLVGLFSAVCLGIQGKWAEGFSDDEKSQTIQDLLWWCSALAIIVVCFVDFVWVLGADNPFCWLSTSIVLFLVGTALVLLAPRTSTVSILGSLMLLFVPVKLLVVDTRFFYEQVQTPFANDLLWYPLVLLGILAFASFVCVPKNGLIFSRTGRTHLSLAI